MHLKTIENKFVDILLLVFCALAILLSFAICTSFKLPLLVVSGVLLGVYYGKNNYEIYHYDPLKEDEGKLKPIAQIDSYWKHIVSGVIGSVSLYIISQHLYFFLSHSRPIRLESIDMLVSLVAALAYMGLLPLTLTFVATAGGKLMERLLGK